NKKLILYAPTFRGEGIEDIKYQSNINELKTLLDDDMVLLIKKHPLIKTNLEIDDVSLDDLYQLLIVADIVISDYSALVFDSMILNKKIILYLYDLISYQKERGLCLDINDLNVEKASTIKEVYDIIAHGNEDSIEYEDNKNKYLKMIDGKANERLLAMIDLIIGEDGNVKE
ncbi:MAG: CDP-glycerol glycerophosphotransferase family protein, partial [Bacilli bacterium]|nr:CDP-glycerol glycerophosphotransferase family protein [Bacilli bacterium]